MGKKGLPPPPPPIRRLGPPPPPLNMRGQVAEVDSAPISIGLLGQAAEVVEKIEADPRAMAAVHELRFFSASIKRTGAVLADQIRDVVTAKLHNDDKVRPWLINALGYARELLERSG